MNFGSGVFLINLSLVFSKKKKKPVFKPISKLRTILRFIGNDVFKDQFSFVKRMERMDERDAALKEA